MEEKQLKKLIKGCVKNDRQSQERLYRLYFDKMFAMCMRYTSDEDLAIELVNDGFLRVFQKVETFEFKGSFEGWVRRLVFHAISNHFRKKKNQVRYVEIESAGKLNQNDQVLSQMYLQDLMELLPRLPVSSRNVFEKYALEGYTHSEISNQLGISVGTSKWHLSNARKLLKELIHDQQQMNNWYVG